MVLGLVATNFLVPGVGAVVCPAEVSLPCKQVDQTTDKFESESVDVDVSFDYEYTCNASCRWVLDTVRMEAEASESAGVAVLYASDGVGTCILSAGGDSCTVELNPYCSAFATQAPYNAQGYVQTTASVSASEYVIGSSDLDSEYRQCAYF